MNNFKVCVYGICKNEVEFIDKWVTSMSEADLVVMTDLGSTDGTIERLREKGVVVHRKAITPWRLDVARNISLDQVPKDMDLCIYTHLNEVFAKGWRQCLEKEWVSQAKRGLYFYHNTLEKESIVASWPTSLEVHTRNDFHWVHPVYPHLHYTGIEPEITVPIGGMILKHVFKTPQADKANLQLLELAEKDLPEDEHIVYDLGTAYMQHQQWVKAISAFKRYLSLKTPMGEDQKCTVMKWIAHCYDHAFAPKEAYGWYFRALSESPCRKDLYIACAEMACDLGNWAMSFYMVEEGLKTKESSYAPIYKTPSQDYILHHLGAISCYQLGLYDKSLSHATLAVSLCPSDKSLLHNLQLIEKRQLTIFSSPWQDQIVGNDRLIHTLLFFTRENTITEDKQIATACLKSLEKSTYNKVIVYNQGYLSNTLLEDFLNQFNLECIVIGNGSNTGTVVGRQTCFDYIWQHYPHTEFISELHLDMLFTDHWEDPLIQFLENNDEPIISAGIIDKTGNLNFLGSKVDSFTPDLPLSDDFLIKLRCNQIVHGFTNPCIHVSRILQAAGGYNPQFLKGKQCFEDDSMLLGYYYYYGTQRDWYPKVNYNSVVYHAVAGQRLALEDSVQINYNGLVKQYGAMGLKHLSKLHKSTWHINYFKERYNAMSSSQ